MSGLDALRAERLRFAGELAALRSSASSRGSPTPSTASRAPPSVRESPPAPPTQQQQQQHRLKGDDPQAPLASSHSPTTSSLLPTQREHTAEIGGLAVLGGVDSPSLRGPVRVTRVSASLITTTAVPARNCTGTGSPSVRGSSASLHEALATARREEDDTSEPAGNSVPEPQSGEEPAATDSLAKYVSSIFQAQQSGKPWESTRNNLEEALVQAVGSALDLDSPGGSREDVEAARAYLDKVSRMLYSDNRGEHSHSSPKGAASLTSPQQLSLSPGDQRDAPALEGARSPCLVRSASPESSSPAQARMSMLSHATPPKGQTAGDQSERSARPGDEGEGHTLPSLAVSDSPDSKDSTRRPDPEAVLQSLGDAAWEVTAAIDGLKKLRASLEPTPAWASGERVMRKASSPVITTQPQPGSLSAAAQTQTQTGSPVAALRRSAATSPMKVPAPADDDSAPEPRRLPPRLHLRGTGAAPYPQALPGGHPFQPSIGYPAQYLPNPSVPAGQWAHPGGPWMSWAPWGLPPGLPGGGGGNAPLHTGRQEGPAPNQPQQPVAQELSPERSEGAGQRPLSQHRKAREAVADGLQKVQSSFWDLAANIVAKPRGRTAEDGDHPDFSPEGSPERRRQPSDGTSCAYPNHMGSPSVPRQQEPVPEARQVRPQHADHPVASLPPKIVSTFQRAIDELHKERRVIPPQPVPLPEPQLHKAALTATERAMGGVFDYSSAAASLEELHLAAKELEDSSKFDAQLRKQAAHMSAFSRHGPSLQDESTFDDGNMLRKAMEQEVEARIAAAYQPKSKRSTKERYAAQTQSSRGGGVTPGRGLGVSRKRPAARPTTSPLKGLSARDPLPQAEAASRIPRPSWPSKQSHHARQAEPTALPGPAHGSSPPAVVERPRKRKAVPVAFGTRVKEPLPLASPPAPKARTPKRVRKDFVPRVAGLPAQRGVAGDDTSPELALRPSHRQAPARESPHCVSAVRKDFLREMARAAGLVKDSPPASSVSPSKSKPKRRDAQGSLAGVQQTAAHQGRGGPLYDMLHALASALLDRHQPQEVETGPDGAHQRQPAQTNSGASQQQRTQQQETARGQQEFHAMRNIQLEMQPQFEKVVDLAPVKEAAPSEVPVDADEGAAEWRTDEQSDAGGVDTGPEVSGAGDAGRQQTDTLATSMDDWVASRIVAEMLVKHLSKTGGTPGGSDATGGVEAANADRADIAGWLQSRQASVSRLLVPDVDPAMAELVTYEAIAEIVGQALPGDDSGEASPLGQLPGESGVITGGGATAAAGSGSNTSMDDAMVQLILRALSPEDPCVDASSVLNNGIVASTTTAAAADRDPPATSPETGAQADVINEDIDEERSIRSAESRDGRSSSSAKTVESDRSESSDGVVDSDVQGTSPTAKLSPADKEARQPATPATAADVVATTASEPGHHPQSTTPALMVSQTPAVPLVDISATPAAVGARVAVEYAIPAPTLGQRLAYGGAVASAAVASRLRPRPTLEESLDYALSDDDEGAAQQPRPDSPATPTTPDDVSASIKALAIIPPLPRMKALDLPEATVRALHKGRRVGRADYGGPISQPPVLPDKGQHRLWRIGQRLGMPSNSGVTGDFEPISELSALSLSDSLDSSTVSSHGMSSGDSFEAIAPVTSRQARLGAEIVATSPVDVVALAARRKAISQRAGVEDSLLLSDVVDDDDTDLDDESRSMSSSSDLGPSTKTPGFWEPTAQRTRLGADVSTRSVNKTRRKSSAGTLSLSVSSSSTSTSSD